MKKNLIFCFLVILSCHSINANEFNRDSILVIFEDNTITKEAQAKIAIDKIAKVKSPEERLFVYQEMLLPHINNEVKDPVLKAAYNMGVHLALLRVHSQLKNSDAKIANMEEAVSIAEESEKVIDTSLTDDNTNLYNATRANVYRINGQMHSQIGNPGVGHEYLYKAVKIYKSLKRYERVANCLYMVAIDFHQIGDAKGLKKIADEMKENLSHDKDNYAIQHSLFAVETAYYESLMKQETKVNYALVDSLLASSRRSVYVVEHHRDEIATNMVPAWEYYALATTFNKFYPNQTDSIFHYLDKTLKGKLDWDPVSSREVDISVNKLSAMVHFRQGKYNQAESEILTVLKWLDETKGRNSTQPDYVESYRLMVDISERKGDFKGALKYMNLLREAESRIYDQSKINAINDVSAKYEFEKKEAHIQNLIREKETAQRIIWLWVGLSIALVIAILLVVLLNRSKRKNIEHELYETALTAELRQNELERIQSTKNELEQNPAQNIIEKVTEMVATSVISKDDKKTYLDRIAKIDAKLLQQVYQTAKIKITSMDMKYIVCFSADIDVKDISLLFNIEPASVHTVRYRIKKKFSKDDAARLLL